MSLDTNLIVLSQSNVDDAGFSFAMGKNNTFYPLTFKQLFNHTFYYNDGWIFLTTGANPTQIWGTDEDGDFSQISSINVNVTIIEFDGNNMLVFYDNTANQIYYKNNITNIGQQPININNIVIESVYDIKYIDSTFYIIGSFKDKRSNYYYGVLMSTDGQNYNIDTNSQISEIMICTSVLSKNNKPFVYGISLSNYMSICSPSPANNCSGICKTNVFKNIQNIQLLQNTDTYISMMYNKNLSIYKPDYDITSPLTLLDTILADSLLINNSGSGYAWSLSVLKSLYSCTVTDTTCLINDMKLTLTIVNGNCYISHTDYMNTFNNYNNCLVNITTDNKGNLLYGLSPNMPFYKTLMSKDGMCWQSILYINLNYIPQSTLTWSDSLSIWSMIVSDFNKKTLYYVSSTDLKTFTSYIITEPLSPSQC